MRKFKYNKLISENNEWLEDGSNEKFCYDDAVDYIKGYLASNNDSSIITDTSLLSTWCLSSAISLEARGDIAEASKWCLNALYSCICGYGVQIDYALGGAFERDTSMALGNITEPSFYMAIALRMGCGQAADDLYQIISLGKQKNYFFEDRICLSTFVSGIYEYIKHGAINLENQECDDKNNPYMHLLSSLSLNAMNNIDEKIYAACDYHVEHSRASTSRRTCVFESTEYAIFPAEIFLYMDVLKTKGFDVSKLSHPLIDTPLGGLGTILGDDLFDCIRELREVAQMKLNAL